jgi:nucleoside-diphosphate-sugar epimerase
MTLWAVTGGRGYVARALVRRLEAHGADVRVLTRRSCEDKGGVVGDIRDRAAVAEVVRGADVVVHLAAYVHRAVRTPAERRECHGVIAGGTATLIEAIGEHSRGAFLVHVSTSNVYAPSSAALVETSPLAPRTAYGKAKLQAEELVLSARRSHGLHASILRPAMVLGPGAPGNFARLIALVRRGIVPEVHDGSNRKSIVCIETLVDSIIATARKRSDTDGEIFNVAEAEALTMREIIGCIARALGTKPFVVPVSPLLLRAGSAFFGSVLRVMPGRYPDIRELVESYAATVVLDDRKLKLLDLERAADLGIAIANTVRAAR